jgi:hypothetical protein
MIQKVWALEFWERFDSTVRGSMVIGFNDLIRVIYVGLSQC